jgi:murE/murF fusion protein
MTLRDLIDGLPGARLIGDASGSVGKIRSDSREVVAGDVFVAVRGIRSDGHAFVPAVVAQGASAIVVEREQAVNIPQVIVQNGAAALGRLVARELGDPAKAMTLVGITGTNGKTTTTFLVESILLAAGQKPGVIGTVSYRWPGGSIDAPYTTPTPQLLHGALARMRDAGCTHVVMEVTSSALAMDRIAGMTFTVGAFSNLTQDHLDVHGTMEAYRDAKRLLFRDYLDGGAAVVNIDDPEGAGMVAAAAGRVLRVTAAASPSADAEIRVVEQDSTVRGITGRVATPRGELALEAQTLIGRYNVENLALAVGIGEALGISHDAITRGIAATHVPGRVERVANDAELDILVDYAHTPDALHNVLSAVRPLTQRRLICVFGCGGDRDPTKRPKMGAAVAELADLAIVTSDNPRTEDPRAIIDQILPAVPKPFFVDVDRRTAIRAAIAEATPGDVVVIAGKGHEDYQVIGTTKHHFDDREEARDAVLDRWRRTLVAIAADVDGALRGDMNGYVSRVVIDSRSAAKGDLHVAIRGETHDGHEFCAAAIRAGASAVLVDRASREWAPIEPTMLVPEYADVRHASVIVVENTRFALGAIARGHRERWSGKLVAVTGSAGKTTTKELVRAALGVAGTTHGTDGSLNNETGVPLTLLGLRPYHRFGVVEMGMRGPKQIEYLTKLAEPDVAIVVNAGVAHIELLGSSDAIAEAKAEIWMGLREGGTVVRPLDDERLDRFARLHRPRARHVTFGERGADVSLVEYTPSETGGHIVLDVFGSRHELELGLVGRHAAIDACAALAGAHAAGASIAQALEGLARARPPAMRGQVVEVGGRKVIVDCYNANPASMAAAMRALAERAQLTGTSPATGEPRPASGLGGRTALAIVGDMLELGDHALAGHREAGALARELGLRVIAIGDHAKTVVEAAGTDAEIADSPAAAARRALARTVAGDWILLKASRGMRLERVLESMRTQAEESR